MPGLHEECALIPRLVLQYRMSGRFVHVDLFQYSLPSFSVLQLQLHNMHIVMVIMQNIELL